MHSGSHHHWSTSSLIIIIYFFSQASEDDPWVCKRFEQCSVLCITDRLTFLEGLVIQLCTPSRQTRPVLSPGSYPKFIAELSRGLFVFTVFWCWAACWPTLEMNTRHHPRFRDFVLFLSTLPSMPLLIVAKYSFSSPGFGETLTFSLRS